MTKPVVAVIAQPLGIDSFHSAALLPISSKRDRSFLE